MHFAVGCVTSMPVQVLYEGVEVDVHYSPGSGYYACVFNKCVSQNLTNFVLLWSCDLLCTGPT